MDTSEARPHSVSPSVPSVGGSGEDVVTSASSGPSESPIDASSLSDRELLEAIYASQIQMLTIFMQLYSAVEQFQNSPMLKMFLPKGD